MDCSACIFLVAWVVKNIVFFFFFGGIVKNIVNGTFLVFYFSFSNVLYTAQKLSRILRFQLFPIKNQIVINKDQ